MRIFKEITIEVLQAVLPLTIVVFLLQVVALSSPAEEVLQFLVGLIFVVLGLILFLVGIRIGLLPMGESIGNSIPQTGKLGLVVFYAFLLGFLVTAAEPDVRVLASQIDMVSDGAIPHHVLIYTVAIGVGVFVSLSMIKVVLDIPLKYILIVCYIGVFIMSVFTPTYFVPISFDAGGVTTGPLTAPFIIALGVGVSSVLSSRTTANDNFGFVALASIGPIIGVMILGVIYG
ncbi:DUF1538 domain-containing protein [Natranaerobius thermophilus]|uniref:DUF1538 domain-containing protein n=1 Tax=Natranaerobius thermophilus (strain ATCC BAA-1301 / DSM 18059 / JW/NM-WN-LF) TaxID=457570 RepID=B2A5A4_NATTJ|nr:DUF1538 domain-containing protein [Natranaerobius thermophilus]ACB83938.1 protein of unknown function DUF1538 [Natranaerobius thermophilus JW/NM-WN-LF]